MNWRILGGAASVEGMFALTILAALLQAPPSGPPSVVVVLMDDIGRDKVGAYGDHADAPPTPHLDALAARGVLFRNAWAYPVCSPTRAALLTGRHSDRTGIGTIIGAGDGVATPLPFSETILPEALPDHTSVTLGKWHLRDVGNSDLHPVQSGFDAAVGYVGAPTYFHWTTHVNGVRRNESGYFPSALARRGTEVLGRLDEPFFLYYATWLVHTPIHTRSEALYKKYCAKLGVTPDESHAHKWEEKGQKNPWYCAMVEMLDYYVGQLVKELETTDDPRWPGHKLIENTYLIFTSDNGGMEGHPGEIITDNFPLDRGKISIMEGGTRVPLIITGPGIKAGIESDVMINGLDFYPTILSLTGTPMPKGKPLDGLNLAPLLKGDPTDPFLVKTASGKPRDTMVWHFPNSVALESSIRRGDYKLVRNYTPTGEKLELFRLYKTENGTSKRVDIEEQKNLAAAHPKKAAALNEKLTAALTEMKASYPYLNPNYKRSLANKEKVPTVTSHKLSGNTATFVFKNNGAKVTRANLLYTDNGGHRYEEWYRTPATLNSDGTVTAILPKGTTHYLINLIDENNFLVSHPGGFKKDARDKQYSEYALKARPPQK